MAVLGACATGDGSDFRPASTTSSTVTTVAPTTTSAAAPTTSSTTVPAGAVTFRVSGLTLPETATGGTGLRLLVRSSTPRLQVRRRGGGGAVTVCPVAGPTAPVDRESCAELGAGATVDVASIGGVELRASGPRAAVEEVAVTYVPADRSTTIVTPARPAGTCPGAGCEATFSMTPGRAGPFVLDGRAAGGRARLVLTAVPVAGGSASSRTLATVEGAALLSIRASLDAGSEARLLHQEGGDGPVAPVTAEILWP